MRTAIIGGRDFNEYSYMKECLSALDFTITEIISGGAGGADTLAEKYAKEKNIKCTVFIADWNDMTPPVLAKVSKYGKKYNALAGFKRNAEVIENSDIVIAFWDGNSTGTKDAIAKAEKAGLRVIVFDY